MIGTVMTMGAIFVAKMGWSAYKEGAQRFLSLLGPVQTHAAKNLTRALGELVARGKNRGLDSYELYRNLEALLPLLCLDACHHRVADQVRAVSTEIARKQHRAMRRDKPKIGIDSSGELRLLLLWDPECAEVFEATKVDVETGDTPPKIKNRRMAADLKQFSWVEIPQISRVVDAQRAFRKSVESIFDRAKEMHETQKKLAAALLDYEVLLESSASDDEVLSSKRVEVEEFRDKLRELSAPDMPDSPTNRPDLGNVDDIAVLSVVSVKGNKPWHRAAYPLLLLINRFEVRRPLRRKREIAELFDAVGATDAERAEIELHIKALYGKIHKRWSADGWIEQVKRDVFPPRRPHRPKGWRRRRTHRPSPFSNFRIRGWEKAEKKRRFLFSMHYSTFELKSPRQLTEEGVLGMVQTMETQEDNVFVRTTRLNRELQQIYDRVQENTRHGKFEAVIDDLKILLDRISAKRKIYPPEMVSQIRSYLAFIYAYRGEHLAEAVRLAQGAMPAHGTWLTSLAIGWCYHRQGKVSAAIKELEAAKAEATRAGSGLLPLVYQVLGDAYQDAERHQDAEQAWQAGLELADNPEWKEQAGLTPFEVAERAGLQKALSERLG